MILPISTSFIQVLAPIAAHSPSPTASKDLGLDEPLVILMTSVLIVGVVTGEVIRMLLQDKYPERYWPNRAVRQIMTPELPANTAPSTPQNLPSTGFTLRLVGNETERQ